MAREKFYRVFVVRFVAGSRGVKSAQRLLGRLAFPCSRGPQPRPGEIWRVKLAGENPGKTVFFLTCIERVEIQRRVAELLGYVSTWEVDIDRACAAIAELKRFGAGELDKEKIMITLRYFEAQILRRLGIS
ncbi:MAG: hypothetical protein IT342_03895 [Candidatus Melainabacteria bacterium]|nr:hypothetical protein [Candidatus Melainabacteria bacterium]